MAERDNGKELEKISTQYQKNNQPFNPPFTHHTTATSTNKRVLRPVQTTRSMRLFLCGRRAEWGIPKLPSYRS
ncbi:hypothetical protein E2C01_092669 [Portunus trituberculatus]|uniref:Uncharacterized protein n=1 Tax=Portunus trituberculatus TaxID=210409 RepID=A0A5B7JW24_PORTR|nr:hypothetical protein [Portunus trituberculatus]